MALCAVKSESGMVVWVAKLLLVASATPVLLVRGPVRGVTQRLVVYPAVAGCMCHAVCDLSVNVSSRMRLYDYLQCDSDRA